MNIIDYYKKLGFDLTNPKRKKEESATAPKNDTFIIKKLKWLDVFTPKFAVTLTINKRKKYMKKMDDTEIHRYVSDRLRNNCNWRKMKYVLFPEYGDKGNLHYHGIVWNTYEVTLSKAIRFYRNNIGFVNKDWSKDIKYYTCLGFPNLAISQCHTIRDKKTKSGCWTHYITKSYKRTGLGTIYCF